MTNGAPRFGPMAIVLHWTVAACVFFTFGLAWTVLNLDRGETKDLVLAIHKSVGLTIFALTLARLSWRLFHPAPAYPWPLPRLQRWAAHATHILLYALTLAMPISGYVAVAARGRETTFFGLFEVPRWTPLDRTLAHDAETIHLASQYVLYALLAAHLGATVYHHVVQRHQLLARIWPQGWQRTPVTEPASRGG